MAINEAGIEVVLVLVHTRPFSSLIKLNKQVVHEAGIEAGIEVVLVRVLVHARPFSSLIKLNKQVVHDPGCNLQHHKYRVNFLYTFINALYFFFFDEEASIKLTKATPKATKNYNKALAAAAATGRPSAASFSPQEERHPATLG